MTPKLMHAMISLRGGFADSLPLQIFGPRMAALEHEPRLGAIGLMLKDVNAALTMIGGKTTDASILGRAAELYRSIEQRRDISLESDISALIRLYQ